MIIKALHFDLLSNTISDRKVAEVIETDKSGDTIYIGVQDNGEINGLENPIF